MPNPEERSRLLTAIDEGQRKEIEALIAAGSPIDIHSAAALGFIKHVEALVAADPKLLNLQVSGRTPLAVAAAQGQFAIVTWLINAGADINAAAAPNLSPLVWAVRSNHPTIADELLAHDKQPLHSRPTKRSMLAAAISNNSFILVRRVVETRGLAPDPADHGQLFLQAVSAGNLNIIEYLTAQFKIHDKTILSSALYDAVRNQHLNVVNFLLVNGAPIDDQHNSGATPLRLAVQLPDYRIVSLLISRGADLSIKDDQGKTALDIAKALHYAIVEMMLKSAEGQK